MEILKRVLGWFLGPKSGRYLDPIVVTPEMLNDGGLPIQTVSLIKQPNSDDSIGVDIVFRLAPKCKNYHALFLIKNEKGESTTRIWLKDSDIVHKGVIHLINTFDMSLVKSGEILVRFEEVLWPTSNYYQYSIPLKEFEIA